MAWERCCRVSASPNEIAKKEMWACLSTDTDLLRLMKMDKESIQAWAKSSDGCVEVEEWDDDDGVTIALKGTEGLRKFAGLVSSRLNGGGRPRKVQEQEVETWEAT